MAFELNGRISDEQQEMHPAFVRDSVRDMVHGDIRYIDDDDWFVDRENSNVWIDGNADAFLEEDIDQLERVSLTMIRVIYVDTVDDADNSVEGFIIDASHCAFISESDGQEIITRKKNKVDDLSMDDPDAITWEKVIAVAYDKISLEKIEAALEKQFALKLGVNGVVRYLSGEDDDEDEGDMESDREPDIDIPPSSDASSDDEDGQAGVA